MEKFIRPILIFVAMAILAELSSHAADISIRKVNGDYVQPYYQPEVDLASASTTTLASINSPNIRITGTTGITSFGAATTGATKHGRFAGVVTLTHSSNLILNNNGSNITTAAGDRFEAWCLSSGTWLVRIDRADGTAIVGGSGSGDVSAASSFGTDNVAIRSDGTAKGVQSSGVIIDDSANISGNSGTFTNGVTTGATGAGSVVIRDASSHTVRMVANGSQTTDINWIFPSAPPSGLLKVTVSGTTNATLSAAVAYTDYIPVGSTNYFEFALSDETTAITTGTAKVTWRAPFAFTVKDLRASLSTASSSGTPTVDINEGGTTIISTKLTIDANEKTSTTAATPYVLSDSAIADDAEITFDIDTAGTGAAGLKVKIYFTRP